MQSLHREDKEKTMERNHKLEFYGGNFGPWISMILLVVGMTAAVLFNYTDFWVYNL